MLISFEGGDGAGKTTVSKKFTELLREAGHRKVLLTREPGSENTLCRTLREIILKPDMDIDPFSLMMLYMADRSEHFSKIVIPALASGKIVITDRCIDSTTVYQAYAGNRRITIDILNAGTTRGVFPELTFFLDVSPGVGMERVSSGNRENLRWDNLPLSFHTEIRERFRRVAAGAPYRIHTVDTTRISINEAAEACFRIFEARYKKLSEISETHAFPAEVITENGSAYARFPCGKITSLNNLYAITSEDRDSVTCSGCLSTTKDRFQI